MLTSLIQWLPEAWNESLPSFNCGELSGSMPEAWVYGLVSDPCLFREVSPLIFPVFEHIVTSEDGI